MLYWALIFFVIATVSALFGFSGITVGGASIAQGLFYVFLIIAVASLVLGTPRDP